MCVTPWPILMFGDCGAFNIRSYCKRSWPGRSTVFIILNKICPMVDVLGSIKGFLAIHLPGVSDI